jgi:probable rRNA maturation factor
MIIDLENNSGYTCNESLLISLINFSLTKLGIHPDSEISLRLVSENEMAELHKKWMGLVGPTDVLSFPMDEMLPNSLSNGPGIIGDIVLCPEYAEKNGKQSLSQELELLTLHGILHLIGYDHEEIEEEKIMFGIQEEYLNQWRALK